MTAQLNSDFGDYESNEFLLTHDFTQTPIADASKSLNKHFFHATK